MECDNKDTRHNEEKKSSLLSCAKLRIASVLNASNADQELGLVEKRP